MTPDLSIRDLAEIGFAVGAPLAVLLGAYAELRLRRVFPTREEVANDTKELQKDIDGLGARLDTCEKKGSRIETLAEANQNRLNLIEQARANDREMWTASGAKLDRIDVSVAGIREELGRVLGEHGSEITGLGREVGEVKKRVGKIEDRLDQGRGP